MFIATAHYPPFNVDKQPTLPASEEHSDQPYSWLATWAKKVDDTLWKNKELQADAYPIWLRESMSINMHSVRHESYYVPIGWTDPGLENGEEIGRLMGLNIAVSIYH